MNTNLLQVLWVEDDPDNIQFYPMQAFHYGLELVPFGCWEDAEHALVSDFKRWSAIILDAKCKYKRGDHDNAPRFLSHALSAITKICAECKRVIPWYVLSGGSEGELNDLIIDSREEWDGDWKDKKYYSKTTDKEFLFSRIRQDVKLSPEMQIRLIYYPDVFKAIRDIGADDELEVHMEDLLVPIHQTDYTGKEYNNRMTLVRKCIELIFQSMAGRGILPNKKQGDKYVLHDILVDKRGSINTTWCSLILSGKDVISQEKIIISSRNILPNVLKDSFHRLIEISASYEHALNRGATESQQANSRATSTFLEYIGDAPYLLRSMVMELCIILLWYASYSDKHKDKEVNASEWEVHQ